MKRIGKWCLSVLLAVTLAMPAMAAQPVSSTEADAVEVQTEESAAETDESQSETKETEPSEPETKETESETKETETSQPETKETETESESETETETETEAPKDPIQELIAQVTASKPVLASAKCTGFQLTVSWKKVSGYTPDGYYLYRKTGKESWKRIAALDADKASYVDAAAKYGTNYIYTVRAYKKVEGKEYRSAYDKNGVSGKVSPAAPKLTAKVKSYKSAVISWSKVNGAEEYAVYVKNASTGKWNKKTTVKGTSYTASATCGQSYTYTVRACKKQGDKTVMSAYDKNGVTFRTKLTSPVLKKAVSKQYNQINISWEKVDGAQKYYVYRKTENNGYKQIGITDELNYTDSSVSCGSSYTYTVRAYRAQGDIEYKSGYDKDGKTATAVPATPALKTISGSDYEKINVKWNAVSGADTYYVYRKLPGGKWSRIGSTSGNNKVSFVDRTAEPYQVYLYTVRAARTVNGKKVMSNYDKTGSCWIDYPEVGALASSKRSKVVWDEIEGVDGYRIYRRTGNGSWSRIATVKGQDNTEYVDTTIKDGTKYAYAVRAYYNVGDKTFLSEYNHVGEQIIYLDIQFKKFNLGLTEDGYIGAFYLTIKNNTGKAITVEHAILMDADMDSDSMRGFELYNSSGNVIESLKINNGKTSKLTYGYDSSSSQDPLYYNEEHRYMAAVVFSYDGTEYLYETAGSDWIIASTSMEHEEY